MADELAGAVELVGARDGHRGQAALLARAAELTSDPGARAERLLASAGAHLLAGDAGEARLLLELARQGPPDAARRLRMEQVAAALERAPARVPAVPAMLSAVTAGPPEPQLARDVLFEATAAALVAGSQAAPTEPVDIARAVRAVPRQPDAEATTSDLLLDGLALRVEEGYAAGAPLLCRAMTTLPEEDLAGAPLAVVSCVAADDLWDDEGRQRLLDRLERVGRAQGALPALHDALLGQAASRVRAGRFAEAEALHVEAESLRAAIGLPSGGAVHRLDLLAWQGREAEVREHSDQGGNGAPAERGALALGKAIWP